MRRVGRFFATHLTLFALLAWPAANVCASDGQQSVMEGGAIVVDGKRMQEQLVNVPLVIRVRCAARQINLAVTVEGVSLASFSDLSPDEYVIEVTAAGYRPAQLNIAVRAGQTANVAVGLTQDVQPSLFLRRNGAPVVESPAPLDGAMLLRTESKAGAAKSTESREPSETAKPAETAKPVEAARRAETAEHTEAIRHADALSCPFEEVMRSASRRLEEFVENVNRVSAIEVLEHERLNKHGKVVEREKRTFNYVAIVELMSPGNLNVEEYRDGILGANGGFPHDMATVGMPSLAMIFHPAHVAEFEMACEGMGAWRERRVWQVRFQQRKDRPARMSDFRVGTKLLPVQLKGVAWIDTENYQIVHLETDLMEAMPEVKLYTEHQALEYGPVEFGDHKTAMWLPQEAEIDLETGGRHFHHRHSYSKYRIFSVEVGQKIGSPKATIAVP
jgi:hypothetical protein